ncbi:MAG: preprotein translocase subunit SecG [Treponema sp.]|nr:preprotein translocase subunit SecG [Treponema sp.]
MEALKVVLIVAFAIVSVLAVLLVLIQNDEQGGMGGLMGGAGTAAFGSRSASVVNKATFVLVILFFVLAFAIARLNKAPVVKPTVQTQEVQSQGVVNTEAAAEDNKELLNYFETEGSVTVPEAGADAPAAE